jgi:hypothetical protein
MTKSLAPMRAEGKMKGKSGISRRFARAVSHGKRFPKTIAFGRQSNTVRATNWDMVEGCAVNAKSLASLPNLLPE